MGVTKIKVNNETAELISQNLGIDEQVTISQKTLTENLRNGFSYDYVIDYTYLIHDTEVPGRYEIIANSKQNFVWFHISPNLITKEHNLIVEFDIEIPEGTYLYVWAGRDYPYTWLWTDNSVGENLIRGVNGHYKATVPLTLKDISFRPDIVYIWIALTSSNEELYPYPLTGYISNIKVYDATDGVNRTLKEIINDDLLPLIPQVEHNTQLLEETLPILDRYVLNSSKKTILADSSKYNDYDPVNEVVYAYRGKTGNRWSYMKHSVVPDFSLLLHIEFDVYDTNSNLGTIWVSPNNGFEQNISQRVDNYKYGHNHLYIDPQYFAAHVSTEYNKFQFWLNPNPDSTLEEGERETVTFYNVEIYQEDILDNIEGDNVKELFHSVDNKITEIINIIPTRLDNILVSPSGNKYTISATDNGQVSLIPLIPTKMAFFGNSLLQGFGYGMAASDSRHDYFYLISEYVKTLNPSVVSIRKSGLQGDFETGTSEQQVRNGITTMVNSLSGDETLVAIQLSDNTRDNQQSYLYDVYKDLFIGIRTKCPSARIVFHGAWYSSTWKMEAIKQACEDTGTLFISYDGIRGASANSYMGAVYETPDGSVQSFSYADVISVTENGTDSGGRTLLDVQFTVNSQSYSTTYPVSTYSYSGTTLTGTSMYKFITNSGVASHPGNEGFRRIANLFLYRTGLSDSEETYPQS